MDGRATDAIVIGGGVAGLAAARALGARGVSCVVVEARDRLGGRVHTRHDAFGPYELGAEFVHGEDETLERWLAGLVLDEVPDAHDERRDGRLVRLVGEDRSFEVVGRFVERVRGRAGAVEDHLASADEPELVRSFVEGFHAADPRRFSVRALVDETDRGGERTRRVRGGYDQLVTRLAIGVDARLGAPVREVRWRPGLARVVTERGELEGRVVVVTVPIPLVATLRFEPTIPRALEAAAAIGFGDVCRVVVRTRTCAWPAGASFLHDPALPIPVWWTEPRARCPTLVGWAGGPRAERIAPHDRGRVAIESLRELVGASPDVLAVFAHDWRADPFARGAYSWLVAGAEDAPEALARPIADTIFFAGEAIPVGAPRGTVQAALRSGVRAADLAARALQASRALAATHA